MLGAPVTWENKRLHRGNWKQWVLCIWLSELLVCNSWRVLVVQTSAILVSAPLTPGHSEHCAPLQLPQHTHLQKLPPWHSASSCPCLKVVMLRAIMVWHTWSHGLWMSAAACEWWWNWALVMNSIFCWFFPQFLKACITYAWSESWASLLVGWLMRLVISLNCAVRVHVSLLCFVIPAAWSTLSGK